VTADPQHVPDQTRWEDLSTEELVRRSGVQPVTDIDAMAHPELWDSDEQFEDFITDLYASRRTDLG